MSTREAPFKARILFFSLGLVFLGALAVFAETAASGYSKRETGLYRDIFDQNIYYQGLQYFHLERLSRGVLGKKKHALNVNVFDEVPNSAFFTNRHGRQSMSLEDLKRGPAVNEGPDAGGKWTITKGKLEGLSPGFFVRDGTGEKYLLKFDPVDYLELATGAEAVTSRFLYAIGYNVPQYTIALFKKDQLDIDPKAWAYDDKTGFRKKFTPERLEEFLLFAPKTSAGLYRVSASRILQGEILGPMDLHGRRKEDPDDPVNHKDRREIRALQVFSAWLNNYDVREGNSLDVVETQDGKKVIRHYLIDFNSSLGARPGGPKPPVFGHENLVDYTEIGKAILSFGFWKKPWQKRWDEAGREIHYPTAGYFDNRYFNPSRYKTQLPYFPFKDMSCADGFWAAKIIMKFTDKEIEEVVSTGKFSDKKDEDYITKTLIERRDIIGRYWFKKANPLDEFELSKQDGTSELRFEDLAVRYGFEKDGVSVYHFDVRGKNGKRGLRLVQEETREKHFSIRPEWFNRYSSVDLFIRTKRQGQEEWSPFVRVTIQSDKEGTRLAGILHRD